MSGTSEPAGPIAGEIVREAEEYHIRWEIELMAGSHREAAEAARMIQRNPLSWAVVFTVTDGSGETRRIDLLDDPDGEDGGGQEADSD